MSISRYLCIDLHRGEDRKNQVWGHGHHAHDIETIHNRHFNLYHLDARANHRSDRHEYRSVE